MRRLFRAATRNDSGIGIQKKKTPSYNIRIGWDRARGDAWSPKNCHPERRRAGPTFLHNVKRLPYLFDFTQGRPIRLRSDRLPRCVSAPHGLGQNTSALLKPTPYPAVPMIPQQRPKVCNAAQFQHHLTFSRYIDFRGPHEYVSSGCYYSDSFSGSNMYVV